MVRARQQTRLNCAVTDLGRNTHQPAPLRRSRLGGIRFAIALAAAVLPISHATAAEPATYYVAPSSQNLGDGSSPENAANWRHAGLWQNVRNQVAQGDALVQFVPGEYNNGHLHLDDLGHPDHHLTLRGAPDGGTIMNADVNELMLFRGLQNATISDFHFTGPIQQYGLRLRGSSQRPSHNVVVENNTFKDMVNVDFGAMGTATGVHHVTIRNNEFDNVGYDIHAHMIYNAHDVSHLTIEHNSFTDSTGDYVRFRDDVDHGIVRHNTFRSTSRLYDRPFVAMPLFNSEPHREETFATNYQIHHNVFEFHSRFTSWNNPALRASDAIVLTHYGYDPPGFNHLMTAEEGDILENGTPEQVYQLLLENTGLDGETIFISDNEYINMNMEVLFGSFPNYPGVPSKGWEGFVDISQIVNRTPIPEPASLMILAGGALSLLRRGATRRHA